MLQLCDMTSRTMVWCISLLAFMLGVLEIVALRFYLYWTVWWFDIIMHFLGGLWVSLITLWFYKAFADVRAHKEHGYLITLLIMILVGVAWEIFEVIAGLTMTSQAGYFFDTVLDLIMDICGALYAVHLVFGHKKMRDE